ncbi:hypothetical protein MXB_4303, partial [Myxobolus squamalis]
MTDYGLCCASLEGLITIWKINIDDKSTFGTCNIIYQHKRAVSSLSSDQSILVSGSEDCTACIFDLSTLLLIKKITTLVSVSRDDKIKIWDLEDMNVKYVIETKLSTKMITKMVKFISNDILLINDYINGIHVICLKNYHSVHIFQNDTFTEFLVIDKYIFTCDTDNQIVILDLIQKKMINKLTTKIDSIKIFTNIKMHFSNGIL